jgi:hypothetical protein
MMGGAAVLPLGAGAAMLGAAWLRYRREFPETRRRVAGVLLRGRSEFDLLWRSWLEGVSSRALRDHEIALLVEKMALEIADNE